MPRAKKILLDIDLHPTEWQTLKNWMRDHQYPKDGMFAEYFYRYHAPEGVMQHSTGIGVVSIARCACGSTKNVTNYDIW